VKEGWVGRWTCLQAIGRREQWKSGSRWYRDLDGDCGCLEAESQTWFPCDVKETLRVWIDNKTSVGKYSAPGVLEVKGKRWSEDA
jgi:hypothetical protein